MKTRFAPNISGSGRLVRALIAVSLLAGAAFALSASLWLAILLLASGLFVAFEAVRGWCALRACGIKTKF